VRVRGTKATIRRGPPLLGKHTEEILMEAGNGIEKIRWLERNVLPCESYTTDIQSAIQLNKWK
jgi:hypothetical protein